MSNLLAGLLRAIPQASIVLLHDGLLIAPPPSASLLSTLHHQVLATAGLEDDGMPFLSVTPHVLQHDELVNALHPPSQDQLLVFQKALISAKRAYRKVAATLESLFQRVGKRKQND